MEDYFAERLAAAEAQVAALTTENESLRGSLEEWKADHAALTAELERVKAAHNDSAARYGDAFQAVAAVSGGMLSIIEQRDAAQAEAARLRERLAAEEQATRDATALMTLWQERWGKAAEVGATLDSALTAAQAEAARLRERLAAEEQATRDATALMTQWQEREAKARAEVAALEGVAEERRERAKQAENERDGLRTEVAALRERLAEAERERDLAQDHLGNMSVDYNSVCLCAERLEGALREVREATQDGCDVCDCAQHERILDRVSRIAGAALAPPQRGEVDAGMPAGTAPEEAAGGECPPSHAGDPWNPPRPGGKGGV